MSIDCFSDLVCPFCGLACDDIELHSDGVSLRAAGGACSLAQRSYSRIGTSLTQQPQAWIAGIPVTLDSAVEAATQLIGSSRTPLFGGLATDVIGMRGLLALGDHKGAVLDHMNSEGKLRNLRTVQDAGWITTTLAEVRNRVDLLVCFGTDVVSAFPRFFERCIWVEEAMFDPPPEQREIVYLGTPADTRPGTSPGGRPAEVIAVAPDRLAEAAALLRGLLAGSMPDDIATDLPLVALRALAERLKTARYGVVVWAASELDFPHADLAVQALTAAIGILNTHTRCAGLPLGGSDGDFSSDAVLLWQTGYPFRTSLASGTGVYDPVMNATGRLLESGEADCLLWVSSLDADRSPPPGVGCPLIVFSCAGAPVVAEAAVQITVATPGIDQTGYMFRADKVVTLPLRAPVTRGLPAVGELSMRILSKLGVSSC